MNEVVANFQLLYKNEIVAEYAHVVLKTTRKQMLEEYGVTTKEASLDIINEDIDGVFYLGATEYIVYKNMQIDAVRVTVDGLACAYPTKQNLRKHHVFEFLFVADENKMERVDSMVNDSTNNGSTNNGNTHVDNTDVDNADVEVPF